MELYNVLLVDDEADVLQAMGSLREMWHRS